MTYISSKRILSILSILFLILYANAQAFAETATIQVEFKVGDVSIDDVINSQDQMFSDFALGQNLGFQSDPVWFRLTASLDAFSDNPHLIMTPVHLDGIEVWANRDGYTQVLKAGDKVISPASMIPEGYSVKLDPGMLESPILIRVESRNVIHPFFEIMSTSEARKMASVSIFWFSISVAFTILYFAWAASAAMNSPQLLLLAFMARLVLFGVTLSVHSGMLRFLQNAEYLPPQDFLHNILGLTYITVAQLFDLVLLRTLYNRKAIKAFFVFIILATILKGALFATGEVSLALTVNNTSALLTLLAGAAMVFLRQQTVPALGAITLSRSAVGAYFALQAFPLILLVGITYLGYSAYLRVFDLMFINYALVPGGFIAYAMIKHQQRIYHERTAFEIRAQHMTDLTILEKAKRAEMKRLLETLAHEIKTPLATLQMAEAVGRIDQQLLRRSTSSIKAALTQISKAEYIERGSLQLDLTEVDLCRLLHKVVDTLDSSAKIDCTHSRVHADWNALYIVLTNLIGNAEKYKITDTYPSVTVNSHPAGVQITIANDLSVPIREPERLFEKYFRDATSAMQPGTGLGLYLSKSLMHGLGATIDVLQSDAKFVVQLTFKDPV
jgi:signal transduction histidine kinase